MTKATTAVVAGVLVSCLVNACSSGGPPGAGPGRRTQRLGAPPTPSPPAPPRWPASRPLPIVGGAPIAPAAMLAGAGPVAPLGSKAQNPRRLRLLLITATEEDVPYLAMRSFLRQIGVPFDTLVATTTDLTAATLSDGTTGYYQAVILASSNLAYLDGGTWRSAFTDEEWRTLWAYEADFGVRQMTFYSYPGYPDDFGLELIGATDTGAAPITASFTAEGRQVFPYLPPTLTVQHAYTYLARRRGPGVTPLLTAGPHALLSVKRYTDGRENLTCTFDQNPDLRHSLLLNYGMVRWLTRGLFLGERRMYLAAHVDDFFIANNVWDPITDTTPDDRTYRMNVDDFDEAIYAQDAFKIAYRTVGDFLLDMTFNGLGADRYAEDDLLLHVQTNEGDFRWLNHTYSHLYMDALPYDQARFEISRNQHVASRLGLNSYNRTALVTGNFSGLDNPEMIRAAYDTGVRFLASDSSVPGGDSPSPNTGTPSPYQPEVLLVPRRPTNIFYNVTTPSELTDEYNVIFGAFWGRELSYDEILDRDSEVALINLLKYDLRPLFFHQANLRRYREGGREGLLLWDFLHALLRKYESLCNLELQNLSYQDIGARMRARMAYDASGAEGLFDPRAGTVTVTVTRAARVPLTGARTGQWQTYGDDSTSYLDLRPETPVTVRVP